MDLLQNIMLLKVYTVPEVISDGKERIIVFVYK